MELGKMYKVKEVAGLTDKKGETGELVDIHNTNVIFTHELRFADGHRENFRPEELEEVCEKLVTEYTKIKFKETDLPFIKGDIATIESVDYDPNTALPYYARNYNKCGWIQQHTFEVIEDEKQPEFLPLGTKLKINNEYSTFGVGSIVTIVEVDESDTNYTYKCRGIDTDLNCEMTFWVESDTFEVIDDEPEEDEESKLLKVGNVLKMTCDDNPFIKGQIVEIIEVDQKGTTMKYKVTDGYRTDWIFNDSFEFISEQQDVVDNSYTIDTSDLKDGDKLVVTIDSEGVKTHKEKPTPQYVLIDTDGDYIEIYNGDYLAYADTLEEATKYDNKEALQLALAVLGLDNITIKEF